MKKILTLIMIASIAISGIFASIVVNPILVNNIINGSNVGKLSSPQIEVQIASPAVNVALYYMNEAGTFEYLDTDVITGNWEIQEAVVDTYTTSDFGVFFTAGSITPVGTEETAQFQITVVPGPFMNGPVIAKANNSGDFLIPTAVALGGAGTVAATSTSSNLQINSPLLNVNVLIPSQMVADFNLTWDSVDELLGLNTDGIYISTTVVTILTI